MYVIYVNIWGYLGYIDGIHVTIYSSTMDPSWERVSPISNFQPVPRCEVHHSQWDPAVYWRGHSNCSFCSPRSEIWWTRAWHGHGMGSCTTWVWSGGWPTLDLFGRSLHQVPIKSGWWWFISHVKIPERLVALNAHNTIIWWSNLQCCFLFSEVYNPKGLNIFMFASCFLGHMCWFPGASYGQHTAARLGQFEKARDIYEEAMATVSTVPWFHFGWLLILICNMGPPNDSWGVL